MKEIIALIEVSVKLPHSMAWCQGVNWFEVGASGTGFEVPDASQRVTWTATGRPLKRWCGDQGFGNVGAWAAEIYTEQGGIVTTVSDASGALHNDAGLDIVSLRQHLAGGWKLTDYPNGAPQLFLYNPNGRIRSGAVTCWTSKGISVPTPCRCHALIAHDGHLHQS